MSIFRENCYKKALKKRLLEKKKQLPSVTFQRLAQACKIQKTYHSRVFNGKAHLSEDQLFLSTEYLGLTRQETEYVFLLYQWQRSEVEVRRSMLWKEIEKLQTRQSSASSQVAGVQVQESLPSASEYYLDPTALIVHMLIGTVRLNDPANIMRHLNLSRERMMEVLGLLESLELIRLKNGRYEIAKSIVNLSPDSKLRRPYRTLIRSKGLERMQQLTSSQVYDYAVVFAADAKTKEKIQEEFLEFLKKAQQLVKKAPPEDVFQMNFDLIPWS